MTKVVQVRMGGYGPPTTTFNRALQIIGDALARRFGDRIEIKYVWNVMDLGHRSEDLWRLVEQGSLTLAYLSTSGLSGRIPELGMADLPFLFENETAARAAIDGAFGSFLAGKIEAEMNYRVLGFFENGFRHISNCLHQVRMPSDLAGMKIRILNSRIHARTFELLGTIPTHVGLSDLLGALQRRDIDAQENPLANTATYGAHKFHRFHTLTNHFYVSRCVFAHRPSFDAWPDDLKDALRNAVKEAIVVQRTLALEEEVVAKRQIEALGCDVIELSDEGKNAFRAAVTPIYREARREFGPDMFHLLGQHAPRLLP
jgi:TRAP-type C4-dicarboxylate transport system substrate-binding protein